MGRAKWCLTGLIAAVVAGAAFAGVAAKIDGISVTGSNIVARKTGLTVQKGHLVTRNGVLDVKADSMVFEYEKDTQRITLDTTDLSGDVNAVVECKDHSKAKISAPKGHIDWEKSILTLYDAVVKSDNAEMRAPVVKIEFADAGVGRIEVRGAPKAE